MDMIVNKLGISLGLIDRLEQAMQIWLTRGRELNNFATRDFHVKFDTCAIIQQINRHSYNY
jgi:hypothetical protein